MNAVSRGEALACGTFALSDWLGLIFAAAGKSLGTPPCYRADSAAGRGGADVFEFFRVGRNKQAPLLRPVPIGMHGTAFPAYRLEWQSAGSLQRRIRACYFGIRAEMPRAWRPPAHRPPALSRVAHAGAADRGAPLAALAAAATPSRLRGDAFMYESSAFGDP